MKNIRIIKVNFITYIFLLLLFFSGYKSYVIYIFIVFFFHEVGHLFFCKLFRVKVSSISIYPYGGIIKLNKLINTPIYKDFLISSGGIIFQLLLYIINLFFIKSNLLSYYNVIFLLFNLLPIVPFDGYKIMFCTVSKLFSYYYSQIICLSFNVFLWLLILIINVLYIKFNAFFFTFSVCFFIKEIKQLNYILNQFYLERYMNNFKFKKNKYFYNKNIKLIRRNVHNFFYDGSILSEKEILAKKFDNSSYF